MRLRGNWMKSSKRSGTWCLFFFALPSLSFNLKSSSSFLFFSTCSKRKTSQRRFPRCPHTNLRQQRAKVTQVGSTQQKRLGWKIDNDTLFMQSRQNQRRKRESRRSWSQREGISSHRVVCCKKKKKKKGNSVEFMTQNVFITRKQQSKRDSGYK